MNLIGLIVMIVGAIGSLLKLSTFSMVLPFLDQVSLPVWGGIFGVGAVVFIMTRRPSN